MKKKDILKISILLIIVLLVIIFFKYYLYQKNSETTAPTNEELVKLKKIIEDSGYFTNSKVTWNEEALLFTIDNDYVIEINSGFYSITVDEKKDKAPYCLIVDAVEMSLGQKKGESITTCEETMQGKINLGGINYETKDGKNILSVNSLEPASLYVVLNTYGRGDLISTREQNYIVEFDESSFTNMSLGKNEINDDAAICGYVYSEVKGLKIYTIKIYDSQKNVIGEQKLNYQNDLLRYKTFCLIFKSSWDSMRYYSIT